jgi:hypothetical protein
VIDEIHLDGHVQLLQAVPQHLHPRMTVGLTALEAPLDRDSELVKYSETALA